MAIKVNRVLGGSSDTTTRIFPNGECVVFRNSIKKTKPFVTSVRNETSSFREDCWRLYLTEPEALKAASLFMGLSLVRNFDSLLQPSRNEVSPTDGPIRRYGRKGITRSGARTVRQAAHLMQEKWGIGRLTFATVTVPNLPIDEMSIVHQCWNEVVERYRLLIRRELEKHDLPTHVLSVSEIQEKRYKKSGVPVLHLHSVWVGREPYGGWGISTEVHDEIWRKAISVAIPTVGVSFKSAANLQQVHSSAGGYLGKYMTKGTAVVRSMVEDGFEGWLPRQWWNASRELTQWVKAETVQSGAFGQFLREAAGGNDKSVWEFSGHVQIDIGDKQAYWLATYGRLNSVVAQEIREYIRLDNLGKYATLSDKSIRATDW